MNRGCVLALQKFMGREARIVNTKAQVPCKRQRQDIRRNHEVAPFQEDLPTKRFAVKRKAAGSHVEAIEMYAKHVWLCKRFAQGGGAKTGRGSRRILQVR